jgi:hypothetical protein
MTKDVVSPAWFTTFYAAAIALFIFYGFSHTVGGALLHSEEPPPPVLYLHVLLSSLWLILFVTQTALVGAKHTRLHRRLGPWGVGLGVALVGVGLVTVIVMRQRAIAEHGASVRTIAFLSIPLFGSLMSFAIPFLAAAALRKRPDWHRPLMLIATTSMTTAAQVRIPWLDGSPIPFLIPMITVGLMVLAATQDGFSRRQVAPGWLFGIPGFILIQCAAVYLVVAAPRLWIDAASFILRTL